MVEEVRIKKLHAVLEKARSPERSVGLVFGSGWCALFTDNAAYFWAIFRDDWDIRYEFKGSGIDPDPKRFAVCQGSQEVACVKYVSPGGEVLTLRPAERGKRQISVTRETQLQLRATERATTITVISSNQLVLGTSMGRLLYLCRRNTGCTTEEMSKGWTLYNSASRWLFSTSEDMIVSAKSIERFDGHSDFFACTTNSVSKWRIVNEGEESKWAFICDDKLPMFKPSLEEQYGKLQSIRLNALAIGSEVVMVVSAMAVSASKKTRRLYFLVLLENTTTGLSFRACSRVYAENASDTEKKFHLEIVQRKGSFLVGLYMSSYFAIFEDKSGSGFKLIASKHTEGENILGCGFDRRNSRDLRFVLILSGGVVATIRCDLPTINVILSSKRVSKPKPPRQVNPGIVEYETHTKRSLRQTFIDILNTGKMNDKVLEEMTANIKELNRTVQCISFEIINQLPNQKSPFKYTSSLASQILAEKRRKHSSLINSVQPVFDKLSDETKFILADNHEVLCAAASFSDKIRKNMCMENFPNQLILGSMTRTVKEEFARDYKSEDQAGLNEKDTEGLTIPEIFFGHTRMLGKYLEVLEQYVQHSTKRLNNLFWIVYGMLEPVQKEREREKLRRLHTRKSVSEGSRFESWIFRSRRALESIVNECMKALSQPGDAERDTTLSRNVNTLSLLVLAEYKHHIDLRYDSKGTKEDYQKFRRQVIKFLDSRKHHKFAKRMAEMFQDFDYLIEICDRSENRDQKIADYAKKWPHERREIFFESIKQFYKSKPCRHRKLVEISRKLTEDGFQFHKILGDPEHGWMAAVFDGKFVAGCSALEEEIKQRHSNMMDCMYLQSLNKITAVAANDNGRISRIKNCDSELLRLEAQSYLVRESNPPTVSRVIDVDKLIKQLCGMKIRNQAQLELSCKYAVDIFDLYYRQRCKQNEWHTRFRIFLQDLVNESEPWFKEQVTQRQKMAYFGREHNSLSLRRKLAVAFLAIAELDRGYDVQNVYWEQIEAYLDGEDVQADWKEIIRNEMSKARRNVGDRH